MIKVLQNLLILLFLVFQAIKHITSGDGGALVCKKNKNLAKKARIIRWFGIDRPKNKGELGKTI